MPQTSWACLSIVSMIEISIAWRSRFFLSQLSKLALWSIEAKVWQISAGEPRLTVQPRDKYGQLTLRGDGEKETMIERKEAQNERGNGLFCQCQKVHFSGEPKENSYSQGCLPFSFNPASRPTLSALFSNWTSSRPFVEILTPFGNWQPSGNVSHPYFASLHSLSFSRTTI